jgi:hypothetical protein
LKPFIATITENQDRVLEQFNIVKNAYKIKEDALNKFEQLNQAIFYLEKAKDLEIESKKYSDTAVEILYNLKNHFKKSIYENQPKLIIKNS